MKTPPDAAPQAADVPTVSPTGQQSGHFSPLITEAAAAKLLGVSPEYLVKWRFLGQPLLPFVRIGKRMIRYRPADIDTFIQSRVTGVTAPPRY